MDSCGNYLKKNGQSLVELALILPLLIFIFLGLFEIGYAIKNYSVLMQASREGARYAVREDRLDFTKTTFEEIGYDYVFQHMIVTMSGQPKQFFVVGPEPNATVLIHHYQVHTGYPCEELSCPKPCGQMEAEDFYINDDAIAHPGTWISNTVVYGYGHQTRLNHTEMITKLMLSNNQINCGLMEKWQDNYSPSNSDVIVVEIFFEQPQLLGVPIISSKYTDPISMYVQTTMRMANK
jgi:hypothetical protein